MPIGWTRCPYPDNLSGITSAIARAADRHLMGADDDRFRLMDPTAFLNRQASPFRGRGGSMRDLGPSRGSSTDVFSAGLGQERKRSGPRRPEPVPRSGRSARTETLSSAGCCRSRSRYTAAVPASRCFESVAARQLPKEVREPPLQKQSRRLPLRQRLDEFIGLRVECHLVIIHAEIVGLPGMCVTPFRGRGINRHPAHRILDARGLRYRFTMLFMNCGTFHNS